MHLLNVMKTSKCFSYTYSTWQMTFELYSCCGEIKPNVNMRMTSQTNVQTKYFLTPVNNILFHSMWNNTKYLCNPITNDCQTDISVPLVTNAVFRIHMALVKPSVWDIMFWKVYEIYPRPTRRSLKDSRRTRQWYMFSLKALFATKITKTNVLRTIHGTPINREKGIKIIVFVLSPSSNKQELLQEFILKELSKKKDCWVECFIKSVGDLKQKLKHRSYIFSQWMFFLCVKR